MQLTDNIYLVGSGFIGLSNEFDGHVYLLDGGGELALVDTGAGVDTEEILDNVEAEGFAVDKIDKILLTHAHADHAGGAYWLQENLDVEVLIPEGELYFLEEAGREERGLQIALDSGGYFPGYKFNNCPGTGLEDKEELMVGDLEVITHMTPGHSRASACFLVDSGERKDLFSGDTVMMNGMVGLLNYPGFSMSDYREVTAPRLEELRPDGLFPGHMMFILKEGYKHLEKAAENLRQIGVPPYIGQCME